MSRRVAENLRTIGEALELLTHSENGLNDLDEWGKAGQSEAKGNLGGSRRVPKEFSARKLGRGAPRWLDEEPESTTARPYIPASWFHPKGIHKILKRILPKMPDVSGCLFLTLTLDHKQFLDAESGYDYSRDQIRRLFHKLRKGVQWKGECFQLDAPYFVKTEFHQDGWVHYHIIFKTRRFLPAGLLRKLWSFGRTNVKRIRNKEFHYLLKYVTKGGAIPDWVLDRERIRIVQASNGFYNEEEDSVVEKTVNEYRTSHRRQFATIRERLECWDRMVLLERGNGTCTTIELPIPYTEFLGQHILTIAQAGSYLGNSKIQLNRKIKDIWKKEIIQNQMDYSSGELLYQILPESLLERMGLVERYL